jgi:cytochrome c biogenesis protein CcmG/thiol:disulfide interchange protein DsbE
MDAQGKVAINYGVRGVPEKYFIDRNGLLVKKFVGPVTAEQLRAIIDEMLSQGDGA